MGHPTRTSFGQQFCNYRLRVGHTQDDVARFLDCYERGQVAKWETTARVSLPDSTRLTQLLPYFELSPTEFIDLVTAAREDPRATPSRKQEYTELLATHQSSPPVYGQRRDTIDTWQATLTNIEESYYAGDLTSARRGARQLLTELDASLDSGVAISLWTPARLATIYDMWFSACCLLHDAVCLLETRKETKRVIRPTLERAKLLTRQSKAPAHEAVYYHVLGDLLRRDRRYEDALNCHRMAQDFASARPEDPLIPLTQRFIILDGPYVLSPSQLEDEITKGLRLADKPNPRQQHVHAFIREGIGRARALTDNPQCLAVLTEAQTEAQGTDPIVHLSAHYSQLLAVTANRSDLDDPYITAHARKTLDIAQALRQGRRVEQIHALLAATGIPLPADCL